MAGAAGGAFSSWTVWFIRRSYSALPQPGSTVATATTIRARCAGHVAEDTRCGDNRGSDIVATVAPLFAIRGARWKVDALSRQCVSRAVGCQPWPILLAEQALKQIVAIVKPYLAEKVLEALKRAPLEACSVREVKGYGRQKNYLDQYAGSEYSLAYLPKVEITLWVDDVRAEEIIRRIVEVARTGRMGDGKIFVLPTEMDAAVIDISEGRAV